MLVQASSLELAAAHSATATRAVEERLQVRVAARAAANAAQGAASFDPADSLDLTDPKALVAKWLFEYLTGKRAPLIRTASAGRSVASAARAAPGWSVAYTRRETVREAEATTFAAQGSVKLASGAEIAFSVQIAMQRGRTQTASVSVQAGNMTDPIAVNLDGAGARLTGDRQAFDLDGDGVDEMIANLAAGSAWLARDRNGNGVIDNGTELFGPASGDGFAELAALDQDGNQWIDEGDPAYAQMGLWRDGVFTPLAQAGVGALSTASAATPFTLEEGGEALGRVRSSSVYLREDGGAGALQQVDLAL
jgi:hypothetical protein